MTALAEQLGDGALVLLGCGKMGSAMLSGWVEAGVPAERILALDPSPSEEAQGLCDRLGARLAPELGTVSSEDVSAVVSAVVLAVKPQMMDAALPTVGSLAGADVTVLSIAAGTPISQLQAAFSPETAVIRAMPNTPSAIGKGISALVAKPEVGPGPRALAEALASAVGDAVWLESEEQLDAVTGLSGSGPAYVFHMIEALAAAGEAEGLPAELAMRLARATVVGAGALAGASEKSAEQLRIDVTSPGGTTAAGLGQLMAEDGLGPVIRRTVAAAAARSRELAG